MGRLPRSTRLTQRPFWMPTRYCATRAKSAVIPFQQSTPRESPPRVALSKRSGWGKKIRPVRNVSLWPPTLPYADPVFSAPILGSCHVLGGRGPVCWLRHLNLLCINCGSSEVTGCWNLSRNSDIRTSSLRFTDRSFLLSLDSWVPLDDSSWQ